ncbi:MAG TPA: indolepyruvate oxidoreductase subunit beta [Anaerohalosphaeraceae bacterium]|nr:indolepyruvate oxidoreductase subunit beta [Anaerohalosphaeraceae bacterium]
MMKKQEVYNITFGGVGGQGIITASELLGWAALYDGCSVKKSEVHGMSQRGGSVESHVRFGRKVYSPLIGLGQADFLLCFHPDEHPRLKPFLRKGGTDLMPYLEKVQQIADNPRAVNTGLMGVLAAFLPIRPDSWERAMQKVFKPSILEVNRRMFSNAMALVK